MSRLLDRLISVIAEEAEVFEVFLELLQHQQNALINNKPEEVAAVTGRLQGIVTQSRALEDERAGVVELIRQSEGINDNLNVLKICDMADEQRSVQLKNLRETILDLYSRIEEMRMRNGLLVEQSLEQIHHTMDMIGRVSDNRETYGREGGFSRQYASLGLDRRA